MFKIAKPTSSDLQKIIFLYKKVAEKTGGIARTSDEVTESYVLNFIKKSDEDGVQFIIRHPEDQDLIIAEIHCYKMAPKVFDHILSELTIVVDPDFHSKGLGKMIFNHLLRFITYYRNDILRVELIARESNTKAIEFYQKLGFVIEGRLEKRIKNSGGFEADIPMAWLNPKFST